MEERVENKIEKREIIVQKEKGNKSPKKIWKK